MLASTLFTVDANGSPLQVWNAMTYSGVSFSFTGVVTLTIRFTTTSITSYDINPHSLQLPSKQLDNQTVQVQLDRPAKFELLVNNGATMYVTNQALYVFADAPETDVPDPDDPSIYYYGPGEYYGNTSATVMTINANETRRGMYLAPGARLNVALQINTVNPFKIWGRGFLYNSWQNKTQGVPSTYGPYAIAVCAMNLELRDFISFGAQSHYLTISYCHGQVDYNISVHNVKQMTTAAETDAFRICGPVSGITVPRQTNTTQHCDALASTGSHSLSSALTTACLRPPRLRVDCTDQRRVRDQQRRRQKTSAHIAMPRRPFAPICGMCSD